jgi:hypothetical protein
MKTPMAYDRLSTGGVVSLRDSAVLGTAMSAGANLAVIQAETQNVRYRDDLTNPTAAIGMLILTTAPLIYDGSLEDIRFIAAAAGAVLNVTLYK